MFFTKKKKSKDLKVQYWKQQYWKWLFCCFWRRMGDSILYQPPEARLWKCIKHHQPHMGKPLESSAFPETTVSEHWEAQKLEASPKG